MTYTEHGHHIPGTPLEGTGTVTGNPKRCGGINACETCMREALWVTGNPLNSVREPFVPLNDPTDYVAKVKKTLINYIDTYYSEGFEKPVFEVYVVWFSKVLQNWKALASTDREDGRYYEITHNGDKHETYVDEYIHGRNTVIPD